MISRKLISGNEAIAYGALAAGVKVVTGYPGTPSTETVAMLLKEDIPETKVEWSVNEKVAFEVAAGAALLGQRALCTMKMSGLNVAYDSLIGIAYSGCKGGLVIYVADDPGVSAGMCEQDTRGFAAMSDMPMLEPATVQECHDLTKYAFTLSETIGSPVFVRSVTSVAQSHGACEIAPRVIPPETAVPMERDITKYTKAGSVICINQHKRLIASLAQAQNQLEADGFDKLSLGKEGGVGILTVGVVNSYLPEAFHAVQPYGIVPEEITTLKLVHTIPFAEEKIKACIRHCSVLVVAEELEPHLENKVIQLCYQLGKSVKIIGKNDHTFSRSGYYEASQLIKGLFAAFAMELPEALQKKNNGAEKHCAARPISVCAGCPHRGTYMAINQAIANLHYKKDEVIVTGDIGCTILGMSAPFNTLWTEVAMGASTPLAQGFYYAGVQTPVISTIGDSTFFHAGITGIINAIQHGIPLTAIIMDNEWTAMTGMQVNPGTDIRCQKEGWKQLDIEKIVESLGVTALYVVDPYDLRTTTEAIEKSIQQDGVSVVLARRQCAIQAARRKITYPKVSVNSEKCTSCKVCIRKTGCPALELANGKVVINATQCNGCGICSQVCKFGAIETASV